MVPVYFSHTGSPLGKLLLVSNGVQLTGLYMEGQQYEKVPQSHWIMQDDLPILKLTRREMTEYFDGSLSIFNVPVLLTGTAFQVRVWKLLSSIPYGQTQSYGQLAQRLGDPGAARTVGHIIGQNPISIIVPCHRVVASTGALTGYNGGLERKRLLLDLEAGLMQLALD